jgi:N-acyl-D-amino-acid deacylase
MLDILIQNGEVVDGSGGVRYRADVGVEGGRIAKVGRLEGTPAATVLDAANCLVTPGFVDMHSHADFTLPILPTADSLVHQGITTTVVGQCGSSPAPLLPGTRETVVAMMASKDRPLPWDEWTSFGSYLDYLARIGTSINVVPLVGQGMVRAAVMGYSAEAPSAAQVDRMRAEIVKALDEGAIGVSTGLIYAPSSYASTEELIAITQPAGERGGFYFSHIRGEAHTLLDSVTEVIRIGRETGAPTQISHFKAVGRKNWDLSAAALELIGQARAEGLDVTADLYPYLASSTGLSATLPGWAREGGKEVILGRLADSQTRHQISADMQSAGYARAVEWDRVFISRAPKNRSFEGRPVAELAAEAGHPAHDWIFDTLLEAELDVSMISFGMCEDNRRRELRDPAMMVGTDGTALAPEGPLSSGKPHPRSYGTFPRVLGRYVREQGVMSVEQAIWKMCGFPAQKLRWTDRGQVKRGYRADLVVLDPDTVLDQATYEAPHQFPVGIHDVIVNGKLVIRDGVHTQARPGMVLARQ